MKSFGAFFGTLLFIQSSVFGQVCSELFNPVEMQSGPMYEASLSQMPLLQDYAEVLQEIVQSYEMPSSTLKKPIKAIPVYNDKRYASKGLVFVAMGGRIFYLSKAASLFNPMNSKFWGEVTGSSIGFIQDKFSDIQVDSENTLVITNRGDINVFKSAYKNAQLALMSPEFKEVPERHEFISQFARELQEIVDRNKSLSLGEFLYYPFTAGKVKGTDVPAYIVSSEQGVFIFSNYFKSKESDLAYLQMASSQKIGFTKRNDFTIVSEESNLEFQYSQKGLSVYPLNAKEHLDALKKEISTSVGREVMELFNEELVEMLEKKVLSIVDIANDNLGQSTSLKTGQRIFIINVAQSGQFYYLMEGDKNRWGKVADLPALGQGSQFELENGNRVKVENGIGFKSEKSVKVLAP